MEARAFKRVAFSSVVGVFLGAAFVLEAALGPAGAAAAEPAVRLFVDAAGGRDDAAREGTMESPFRTITYALLRAAGGGWREVALSLAPGEYSGRHASPGEGEAAGEERFPVPVPPGLAALSLEGPEEGVEGADPRARISSLDACGPLFAWDGTGSGEDLSLELRRVALSGILAAGMKGAAERHVSLKLEACRITIGGAWGGSATGGSGTAIEVSAGEGGSASVEAAGCRFELAGGASGVRVETTPGAVLDLSVEACSFHASPLSSPAAIFLPAAVDVHVDSGATVSAVIERNIFRGTAVAARLTASDDLPGLGAAGRLQARIRGNLIHGEPAAPGPGLPAAFSVRHAFYLSLFPNHELDLLFAHNTVVGVEGFVVHEDNLDLLRERGKVVPFTFANNICRQVRASSEFAAEVDGPAFPQTARGVVIASNLLEKSSVGREEIAGNFTAPPGFVDEAGFDFHLLAGSPAVNRGDNLHAEGLAVDLDGRCRITATQCGGEKTALFLVDLGCYESDGTCGPDDVLFRRGDCNGSGTFDLTDAVFTFTFLFLGGERPACGDGCDADDSGAVNLTDGIYFLNYLFLGGEPPPAPYPESGVDPTCDQLPCR